MTEGLSEGIQVEFLDQPDQEASRSGCSSVYSAWLRTMCRASYFPWWGETCYPVRGDYRGISWG